MKNSKIRIIKTSVGSVGKVTLIRELQKSGVFVIGTDMNPMSSGLYIADKKYLVPKGNKPNFLQSMIDICKIEKPNLILPDDEFESLTLSENKNLFEKMGIILLCPDFDIIKTCFDKKKTKILLNSINIPTPKIFTSKNAQFPCIIKPNFGSGSEDVYLVRNENDLKFYISKVESPLIEEYIQGEEFSIDILSDLNSEPLSIIPRLRIQTESGISTKSIIKNEQTIINFCKKISKELKLKGPSCVQCIKNKSGIKFIEINNRFGGGSILSIYACKSIIKNLIKIAKKEKPISDFEVKDGLTMLRYYNEVFLEENDILTQNENI
tara:strand:- start:2475 stop:3443 length:969 start_codon:yes stop_codon:yes gene_type:complete